jgi:ABC-type Mn2+/Zn2+ transport system permease subunit
VIAEFVSSWALFHNAYLAGWLIAVLLALIGVVVVARDQIFIGAAVSQASTLGIAAGMRAGDLAGVGALAWMRADGFLSATAVVFSALAALVTTRGGALGHISHEALTGWVFLLSASLAILVVSNSAHGLEEIHRLVSSSIISATAADLWIFGGLAAVTAAVLVVAHRRLLLIAMDPPMAAAVGLRVGRWSGAISLWLGVAVGLSIRCAGVLYAFGSLVLPALLARDVCREVRPMFVVAPVIGVATAAAGFVVAHHYDYPPGQMTVALQCVLLAALRLRGLAARG